jgi:hypothetical protein
VTLFHRAAELAFGEREEAEALLALGRLDTTEARYPESLARLRQARAAAAAAGDLHLEAHALAWESRAAWLTGAWEEALEAANAAIDVLGGLPETPELARALARRSQLEMLKSRRGAAAHADQAAAMARRVGDGVAEANARINAFTARAAAGTAPDADEVREIVGVALDAAAYEEAFRAIINLLWSGVGFHPLAELERHVLDGFELIEQRVGRMIRDGELHAPESFGPYVELSLAKLLYVPSGDWKRLEAVDLTEGTSVNAGTRIVRLELAAGMALRRGDVGAAGSFLSELVPLALPSDEPQRILPTAGVGLWYAIVTGDADLYRTLAGAVLVFEGREWSQAYAEQSVPRALFAHRDLESLGRLAELVESALPATSAMRTVTLALLARGEGRHDEGAGLLAAAVARERSLGAAYSASCLELELAAALEASGDATGAGEARRRAETVLQSLGVVHPF